MLLDAIDLLDALLAARLSVLDCAFSELKPLLSVPAAPPPQADNTKDKVAKPMDSLILFNSTRSIVVHLKIRNYCYGEQ